MHGIAMMDDLLLLWHDLRLPFLLGVVLTAGLLQLWRRHYTRRSSSFRSSIADVICNEEKVTFVKPTVEVPPVTAPTAVVPTAVTSQPVSTDLSTRQSPRNSSPPKHRTTQATPRRITGRKPPVKKQHSSSPSTDFETIQPVVFFSSLSGTTENAAASFSETWTNSLQGCASISKPHLLDLSEVDYDDYFTTVPKGTIGQRSKYFYIILVPTYNIDTYLDNFVEHLKETHHDFRVDTAPLSQLLGYAVFGFGDKEGWPTEADGFCSQAKEVDKWMARLSGRKRAYPMGMGDVKSDAMQRLCDWRQGLEEVLRDLAEGKTLGEGVPGSGEALESEDEEEETATALNESKNGARSVPNMSDDMENLGLNIDVTASTSKDEPAPLVIDFTTYKATDGSKVPTPKPTPAPKEMVPKASPTYAALTKQGYTIVGSHSGVKICRWTKSALRGRGSCYKFSFYGIKSHLCMETTPSLSCSNKCVFCWRHGTNPVGTTWRWTVDPPDLIFAGAKAGHYQKIKMMRGVPGVRAERFEEAMRIRHCALSLVGEPIFYPHINEFLHLLHAERISSFLVCNAQHPAQLAALNTVTQLYVSIDASTKDSLRRIDRPLHRDFWERLLACLDILRERRFRQRTVFRLTLVKGFNMADEAQSYADLIARGLPCFVEVKGVTYCGTSTSAGAGLTMQNVPFYEEVCAFVQELVAAMKARGLDYGIAAEHAHSCCVLIGSERFLKGGVWNTVIDYSRFFELLESGREFMPEDYCSPTAEWAHWGKGGFDPADERVMRKKGTKTVAAGMVEIPDEGGAEAGKEDRGGIEA